PISSLNYINGIPRFSIDHRYIVYLVRIQFRQPPGSQHFVVQNFDKPGIVEIGGSEQHLNFIQSSYGYGLFHIHVQALVTAFKMTPESVTINIVGYKWYDPHLKGPKSRQ